jgi:hypothetical protein
MRARSPFVIVLVALCVMIGGCKISYGLHRHRLPDFTLDVDPSFTRSYRFRFSRDGSSATLTTTVYENTAGRRGQQVAAFRQVVDAADIDALAASMKKVSFFEYIEDSDMRDGEAWVLRLNSFPFASLATRTFDGLPGLQEIAARMFAISEPVREERYKSNNTPQPTPTSVTSPAAKESRQLN